MHGQCCVRLNQDHYFICCLVLFAIAEVKVYSKDFVRSDTVLFHNSQEINVTMWSRLCTRVNMYHLIDYYRFLTSTRCILLRAYESYVFFLLFVYWLMGLTVILIVHSKH